MIDIDVLKQAITLTQEGNFSEAEKIYLKLLETNPNECALLSAAGLFYVECGNYNKASELLKKACEIKETFGTVSALGFALYENHDYENAVTSFKKALLLGESVDIYNKLILSLFETKNYKEAIELTDKMCELYPDNPKAIATKVKSLTTQGKLIEAEKECVGFLRNNPEEPSLWHHLGLLKELIYSDDKQAIECYKIAGEKGSRGADYNIAVAYQKLGDYKKAEEYYKKFLSKFPDNNDAIISLGLCYLSEKKFKEGYGLLYKRKPGNNTKYTNNLWTPESILDKELLIIGDQGYGDRIQFARYFNYLKNHNIKAAVGKQLTSLFKYNFPEISFIEYNEINPKTQAIRITDLPYVLDMDFDNIPDAKGYLDIESADIQNDKTKVGLCWEAGSAGIRGMINRTINVKCFEPLFNLNNIQLYSFQVTDTFDGNTKYADKMINLAKDFKDFTDTARALKSMDFVVTVDTCIAHLSGALGIKTYLLLPYSTDWRWFGGNEKTTPWYESIELFKQTNPISWENEIESIVNRFQKL